MFSILVNVRQTVNVLHACKNINLIGVKIKIKQMLT